MATNFTIKNKLNSEEGVVPQATEIIPGEIAINNAAGSETMFIVNTNDEVVPFESTNAIKPQLNTISSSVDKIADYLEGVDEIKRTKVDKSELVAYPTKEEVNNEYLTKTEATATYQPKGNYATTTVTDSLTATVDTLNNTALTKTEAESAYTKQETFDQFISDLESFISEYIAGTENLEELEGVNLATIKSAINFIVSGNADGNEEVDISETNLKTIKENIEEITGDSTTEDLSLTSLENRINGMVKIVTLTQAEYDDLEVKDPNTLYCIPEEE